MTDKTPCYVCGVECKDWSKDPGVSGLYNFISCCGKHYQEIWNHTFGTISYRLESNPCDNGFADVETDMLQYAKVLKMNYANTDLLGYPISPGAPIQPTAFPEAPCRSCSRNNDVGNPKVKICWNCETPL